ncbi:MAG: metallophosphoesterase family protein [[Clostridium] scindens]
MEGEDDYIQALADCPAHITRRSNNDFSPIFRARKNSSIEGFHVFITHGHYYYVSMSEERLKEEARGRGADIVMYGHTHKPSITREDDLITLNPGSLSYPRQEGRRPSYMLMEIDQNGHAEFTVNYL